MAPFGLSQPTISKHLKVLEKAGLIEGGRDAQRRPRRLAPLAMKDIADWIEPFRQQWESRLNNLDAHLAHEKAEGDMTCRPPNALTPKTGLDIDRSRTPSGSTRVFDAPRGRDLRGLDKARACARAGGIRQASRWRPARSI